MELILNIDNFQGPLDLLLFMEEKKKIKIEDINISQLIEEYLEVIRAYREDNFELKVEFVLVASELLEIKTLELIKSELKHEKEQELRRRIEEYKMIKELSEEVSKLQNENNISYSKAEGLKILKTRSKEILLKDLKQMDLFVYYKNYLATAEVEYMELDMEKEYSIEIESEKLYMYILEKERSLKEIFERSKTKLHLIYLFLSILELYKEGLILISGDILSKVKKN